MRNGVARGGSRSVISPLQSESSALGLSIEEPCPGWVLTPEGAAVHPVERTAVIADVHLGYEWARGGGGDALPAHSLGETLSKLASLLDRGGISRVVVAGDLVESPLPCRRTAADVEQLRAWLDDRNINFVPLPGNHDPVVHPQPRQSLELAGWTISHGDRRVAASRQIVGHHHPALRANGLCAPCFVYGPRWIVLPAFSPNAAGLDVSRGWLFHAGRREGLRCAATLGGAVLDFGPLSDLGARIRAI